MDFSDALRVVKDGRRVRRPMWRELDDRVGAWVELMRVEPFGEVLACPKRGGGVVLFACSQWDILAEDWEEVPP